MINWELLYNKLLETKSAETGEKHHIVPKHDGGKDEDGLVILERKHHILAHYIRFRWKGQVGDRVAYKMMSGQETNPSLPRKLFQVDVETGNVIAVFYGAREAQKSTGTHYTKISEVCNGKRNKAGGYKWFFEGEAKPYTIKKKQVKQIDISTGKILGIYSNLNEAEQKTGVNSGQVYRVSLGQEKTAGGFKWETTNQTFEITPKI
jgi:hypothetical protein